MDRKRVFIHREDEELAIMFVRLLDCHGVTGFWVTAKLQPIRSSCGNRLGIKKKSPRNDSRGLGEKSYRPDSYPTSIAASGDFLQAPGKQLLLRRQEPSVNREGRAGDHVRIIT